MGVLEELHFSTSTSDGPVTQVTDCRELKAAIEGDPAGAGAGAGAAGAGAAPGPDPRAFDTLVIWLHSDLPYFCEEGILIAKSQSVVLVGSRDGRSNVHVAPNPDSYGSITRSLFVNTGTLVLKDISFYLDSSGEDRTDGGGGEVTVMAGEGEIGDQEENETWGVCAGAVRLIRNSGHVAMREISVFDASSESGCRPERRCGGTAKGRVVFSNQGDSRRSGSSGSGGTARSVVVSHSDFSLAYDERGASAFHVDGGKLEIDSSRFYTHALPVKREGESESPADMDGLTVAPALEMLDADAVVTDTAFVGFGGGEGRGSGGAFAFEEADGLEGQHWLLTSNNSFSGSHGDQPYGRGTKSAAVNLRSHRAELDGEFYASAVQFREQDGLRRLKSCSGLRCLDQGLLLVIISAGLFAILMGMCCLENWLRMNPDGLDRWLPRRFRSTRVRRVQHDHNAEKSPASQNSGVDLGGLEAAERGAAITKPLPVNDSGTGGMTHGGGPIRASSTHLHADQYSVYDGTCDEEVSFVVPQTFKHVLAKPQANVRSTFSRESGFMDVSLEDDAATTTTTESRSSSNGSTAAAVDAKRSFCPGFGAFMHDEPPCSAAVYHAATRAAASQGTEQVRLDRDRPAYQEFDSYMDGVSTCSPAASAAAASDATASEIGRIQLEREIREDSLSPDSLQGDSTPCGSVSTSTDMYESGSLVLIRSPLPEETIQAFASVNSLGAAALDSSPVIQHSGRRLEMAIAHIREETKAESDGEDSMVAAEETEGRAMSDLQRAGCSPAGGGFSSLDDRLAPGVGALWTQGRRCAPSTVVDDRSHRSPASFEMSATKPEDESIPSGSGIVLKAAPFSPLQSPAESSFSALSMGALSKVLHRVHGGDAIPAVERAHQPVEAPVVITQPAIPSQHDGDMCYSPDSEGDREDIGSGFHSNNPMLMGQWTCTEETVDGSAMPGVAAAEQRDTAIDAADDPAVRSPCSQALSDDRGGSCDSSSPAASHTSNGVFHSTRFLSTSSSSEAAASQAREAAGVTALTPDGSAPFPGDSSENTAMSIAAPGPVDHEDDGMCYSSPSTDGNDERRHDDTMCYSSPSTDGSGEIRDEDDRRMFAVSPAFSSPGRCIMGVSPDDREGHLLSQIQADSASGTSAPKLHDGFLPASTTAEEENSSSTHGVGLRVSEAEDRAPGTVPRESAAGDFGGAGVSGVMPAPCTVLSPVTSSYSLYCSPPSTVGGPSPAGTPVRGVDHRHEHGAIRVVTGRPQNTTVESLEDLSSP